ncbi:hypothetical protein I4U23_016666 [Adineta vaga]|nr:hypothetical protein I4U23_016666 [Adineta vaga]
MNQSTFDNLVSSVAKESFSDAKVNTIKTTLHCAGVVSSSQMAKLVQMLSFDSAKVEVAKAGFRYAIDRGSYPGVVGGALVHSSSKEELNEYIMTQ